MCVLVFMVCVYMRVCVGGVVQVGVSVTLP